MINPPIGLRIFFLIYFILTIIFTMDSLIDTINKIPQYDEIYDIILYQGLACKIERLLNGRTDYPKNVVEAAVRKSPYCIKLFDNVDDDLVNEALDIEGLVIQYVKNPTREQKLIAVRNNGYAIKYMEQDEELQIEAVRTGSKILVSNMYGDYEYDQVYDVAKYITDPSKRVQLEIVRSNPLCIKLITNLDKSIFKSFDIEKVRKLCFCTLDTEDVDYKDVNIFIEHYINHGNNHELLLYYLKENVHICSDIKLSINYARELMNIRLRIKKSARK